MTHQLILFNFFVITWTKCRNNKFIFMRHCKIVRRGQFDCIHVVGYYFNYHKFSTFIGYKSHKCYEE
jgi:hypothetical protein